jgi:AcrR family transcriptional regulator
MKATATTAMKRGKHGEQQRRQAFIEAATRVFAEKGYDCATTREIAERASCSEGLIHRYFGGKRGLLAAILESKTSAARDAVQSGLPDRDDLLAEVEQVMTWWLDYAWENRDFLRVAVSQAIIDPDIGEFVGGVMARQRAVIFREKLLRHQQAGRIAADVDLDAIAEGLAGITFSVGFLDQVVFAHDADEVRRRVVDLASMIVWGIARRDARGGE